MRQFFAVIFSLVIVACTVEAQPSRPTAAEAKRAYVSPSICSKQAACLPDTFSLVYPGGAAECEAKLNAYIAPDDDEKQSACTRAELETCRNDYAAAACPSDPKAGGLPPAPASCSKC